MTLLNKILNAGKRLVVPAIATYYQPTLLGRGKWIIHENKVGIIADIAQDGMTEIHYVNAIGETVGGLIDHVSKVRVAKITEIPEARRPSLEKGLALGYLP